MAYFLFNPRASPKTSLISPHGLSAVFADPVGAGTVPTRARLGNGGCEVSFFLIGRFMNSRPLSIKWEIN
jgi:hypothetical protein